MAALLQYTHGFIKYGKAVYYVVIIYCLFTYLLCQLSIQNIFNILIFLTMHDIL